MQTNQLISGKKYLFLMNPADGAVIGILPEVETGFFLTQVFRKNKEYLRIQREDQSTYLIDTEDIQKIMD